MICEAIQPTLRERWTFMSRDAKLRASDEIATRTEQKLDDFIDQYRRDMDMKRDWHDKMELRIKPLEDLNEKLRTPLQVFIWICAAAFGGAGIAAWRWFERHFNQ